MKPSVDIVQTLRGPVHAGAIVLLVAATACGPRRSAVVGSIEDPGRTAEMMEGRSRLDAPTRIDFTWELNEGGSRITGVGVARIEPPYRARLDLFLDNEESVLAAALVDDDLRLSTGAPDDILPPVELMWGTLGVFRPMTGSRLVGGDRLEEERERLRYSAAAGEEIHFEVGVRGLERLELVDGRSVVQWVRLESVGAERFPRSATYRNLVDYRELKITRTSVRASEPFDSAIWDPRE